MPSSTVVTMVISTATIEICESVFILDSWLSLRQPQAVMIMSMTLMPMNGTTMPPTP